MRGRWLAILPVFFLLPLLFLSGCVLDGFKSQATINTAVSAVSVHRGDNLYMVARRYDVPLQDLIELNNLKPPYGIYPGQALRLPIKRIHIVRRFETVHSIARKQNIDVYGLVKMNNLKQPYTIYENQRLQLPSAQGTRFPKAKWAKRPKKIEPLLPLKEEPKKVEPLLPLAEKQKAVKEVVAKEETPSVMSSVPPQKPSRHSTVSKLSALRKANVIPQVVVKEKVVAKAVKKPTPPKKALKQGPISKFQWPLRGRILARYGKKTGGLRNDGINIAAKMGSIIKAAEDGHVVYVGSALKGYGNLVLIRHRDSWITTYAHCKETFVAKGDVVKKGQKIATVGTSGNVKKPQLHFEVRKKTRTVDPLHYLQ